MGGFPNNTVLPTWKWGLFWKHVKEQIVTAVETDMVTFPQSHCERICYLQVMDFNDLRWLHNPTLIPAAQKVEIGLNVLSIPKGKTFGHWWHISMAHKCHKSHRILSLCSSRNGHTVYHKTLLVWAYWFHLPFAAMPVLLNPGSVSLAFVCLVVSVFHTIAEMGTYFIGEKSNLPPFRRT